MLGKSNRLHGNECPHGAIDLKEMLKERGIGKESNYPRTQQCFVHQIQVYPAFSCPENLIGKSGWGRAK